MAPVRCLIRSGATQCLTSSSTSHMVQPSLEARRTIFGFLRGNRQKDTVIGPTNPILDEYLKKKPTKPKFDPQRGDLTRSSIFDEGEGPTAEPAERGARPDKVAPPEQARDPHNMAIVLDPRPRARQRWQRKMVIREVQRRGRLSKAEFVKRTERESVAKSPNLKTSIKKLGPLARQISGKTVDDAITQMKFSKKKAAKDVLEHLEYARDLAVVKNGMGLGPAATVGDNALPALEAGDAKPLEIQLKDGKRHKVADPSKMYIDQAWVGRGPFGKLPDYRAKGRIFIMRTPWTHLTLKLKEESTRIREWQDRENKRNKARLGKVWQHLPDRPINGQTQWYTW